MATRAKAMPTAPTLPSPRLVHALSDRERTIVGMVCDGYIDAEIATNLARSLGTVRKHIANVYQKLGISRRPVLVRWGISCGLGRP